MNKHLHRLVFNPHRGQLVAVAESAAAQGQAGRGQTAKAAGAGPTDLELIRKQIIHRLFIK